MSQNEFLSAYKERWAFYTARVAMPSSSDSHHGGRGSGFTSFKDERVVRGPHREKSKGGGGTHQKAEERLTEHIRAQEKDDAARREMHAEADEREHREAGLWGDSLFGGGTGMWHPPADRPDLPTDEDEMRELLARAFPLPRVESQPPALSDSDSDSDAAMDAADDD